MTPADVMRASAKDFLRSGGTLDWNTWSGMTGPVRAAFIDAGAELETERAGRTVVALASAYVDVMDARGVEDMLNSATARIVARGIA